MDAQLNHMLNLFGLTSGQRLAASERARNTIVTPGADSIKSRTLVARYLGLLSEGLQPRQGVAVTFTEKAAREMRSRTRTLLHQVLRQAGSPAEQQRWVEFDAQMDSVRIGTIHKIVPLDMCHPGRLSTIMILFVHNPYNLLALHEHTFAASHTTSASQAVVWIVGTP